MNKFFVPFIVAVMILEGCGGSSGGKKPVSDPGSVSSLSSSLSSSSSSVSSKQSSQSSLSSSSVSSSISSSTVSSSSSTSSASSQSSSIEFKLTSNSFVADAAIPIKYSCFSTEVSPHLKWEITSPDVKSFVLIMEDIDAVPIVQHPYVHWDVYNIPSSIREIAEGATLRAMPMGSIEGANDDNVPKYSGPCPPTGTGTHHYYFELYAMNTETLTINANKVMRRSDFETLYASKIIAKAELMGSFKP